MLLGIYFFVVIALPLALGSYVLYNGLPRSRQCPACADETLRLQSFTHAVASRATRRTLHQRWCMRCGWRGTVRIDPGIAAEQSWATPAFHAEPAEPTGPARPEDERASDPDRVDLRTLDVDGHSWRVMVECWAENGRWVARLVFVAPGGQVCADRRSLEGKSVLEVISQAFRLPEKTLAGRLRRSTQ